MSKPPEHPPIRITPGFHDHEREVVARLFWAAFRGKLHRLLRPEDKAIAFVASVLAPGYALTARGADGELLGVAGFKTGDGGLIGGDMRDLARVYGWAGAAWRGVFLAPLERRIEPGALLMDGIFVAPGARGCGAGTALLQAVKDKARDLGADHVRLDVIDSNPRARALYERQGFVAGPTTHIGPLRHLFGFRTSTEMRCPLPAAG